MPGVGGSPAPGQGSRIERKGSYVVALIVLALIVVLLGGFGFLAHVLWIALLIALALWLIGFFVGSGDAGLAGGRRRWYGR